VGDTSLDDITPFFQIPRVVIPAGFTETIVEPAYRLKADGSDYEPFIPAGTAPSKLAHPMPISMTFFANQGEEPELIRIGTAYEAATMHRAAPPMFGPLRR
jgi:amidase